MANSVDLVIGSEAIKQVENLISKLSLADAELIKISQSASNASKGIGSISTPSALDRSVSNTAALNAQLEKQNAIINKLHVDIAKKADQSRLSEIKLQQAREKAFDSYSKALSKKESDEIKASNKIIAQKEKEFAIFEKQFNKYESDLAKKAIAEEKASQRAIISANKQQLAEEKQALARRQAFDKNDSKLAQQTAKELSAYNRIQASVNLLTKTYQDLAIRKQLGNTLSSSEEKQLVSITSRLNTYQTALKSVDANMQKHTRNVGNYASGYNGLGNSINQITRELPAFTFSAQTGFLALSNNIPILTDEIGRLVRTNKELVASGKPVTSVFRQILGGVISLQTLMGVAILAFTLYGKEIGNFFTTLFKGKDIVRSLAENQKLLNETLKESSGSYAEQKVNIDVLYKSANDLNASYKNRKLAVDELQQLYPFYFANLSDEAIMTGQAKDQYLLLSNAIVTVAKARASEEILQKRESERLIIEQEQIDLTMKKYKELSEAKGTTTYVAGGGSVAGGGTQSIGETAEQQRTRLRGEIQNLRTESVNQRNEWAKEDAFFIKKITEGNTIEQTLKPAVKETKSLSKSKQEKIEIEKLEIVSQLELSKTEETALVRLKQLKSVLEKTRDETSKNSTEFKEFEKSIAGVNETILFLTEGIQPIELDIKVPSGDSPAEKLKSDWKDTFNAIADSAQQAGDIIAEFSARRFEDEYARLEAQKDISLQFAGEGLAARQKIEEDYEKKRRDIANRENKAKQKQAIFNIAIDTAQAIMATVGKTGFAGLPLALILGALGAAQIAMVASQKIPQYFDGTDNHAGGMMLVNDGAGSNFQEKVILPNGKEIMPEGRNVLMNAPKGTKVLTHEQQIMQMLNERGVSMNANYNKSNGMTANEMDSVLGKHFSKIQTNNTTFDKKGMRTWSERNGNRTIQDNNRVSRTGFKI